MTGPKLFDTQVSTDRLDQITTTDVTLRDVFAAVALHALVGRGGAGAQYIARSAYEHADAMLAARQQPKGEETNG